MPADPLFLILGSGYTGSRVARLLRARGHRVTELHRAQVDLLEPGALERLPAFAEPGCRVLHSIPSLDNGADATCTTAFQGLANRMVYLSTTGVYGSAIDIDEHTVATGSDPRARARLDTENAVRKGPWQSMILRPAAIYGPGRGAHVSIPDGRYKIPGDGKQYISRIHVDDLAALAEAALLTNATGTYPVADDHPATSLEIATYCANLLGVPLPQSAPIESVERSRQSNRRVDGRAIRKLLGVELRYPSFREGIPAAIQETATAISTNKIDT